MSISTPFHEKNCIERSPKTASEESVQPAGRHGTVPLKRVEGLRPLRDPTLWKLWECVEKFFESESICFEA